jgi:hypothetical protein
MACVIYDMRFTTKERPMAKKFKPVFDEKESAILLAMYEVANGAYTSFSLSTKLNPTVKLGTPAAGVAFEETRAATERLIVKGLVSGERLRGASGVYFNALKLTPKGERSAIEERETRKRLLTEMESVEDAVSKIEELMKEPEKEQKE